jgi:ABC-type Na+ efflux pump permease subunit
MVLLAVLLAAPLAGIATLGGSAGADTTIAVPTDYPTIQQAIAAADGSSGNVTITIAKGTYTENDTVDASGLTSLTLKGAGASTTTIDGGSNGSATLKIDTGNVVVSDLTIAGGSDANGGGIDDISPGGTLQATNDNFDGSKA